MKNYFLAITFNIILSTLNLIAQWQPDVRLTNNTADSHTSYNNVWCIAASGNVTHAVWWDVRDGNEEIYYKRSTDGGVNWGADTRLTNDFALSFVPSVFLSDSTVHVVWTDARDGNDEIYYKRSTDNGVSWGTDMRLTNNPDVSWMSSISVSGSVVHVVWTDARDGNDEIYYKRSTDDGVSWGTDIRLTNNPDVSEGPTISVSGSFVHVVWRDTRDGNDELYYKRSTDDGISWGTDIRLTNNSGRSWYPCISVSDSVVHVVWMDNHDITFQIYYKRSTDGGINWGTDIQLTNNIESAYPSIAISGSIVHVAWNSNDEIYYKRSTDNGMTWEANTQLMNDFYHSWFPSVTVSGSAVHIIWEDNRDGNWEIYYKRNPTGNVIGIENISSEIPKQFLLMQNYPNPFNPRTIIRCMLPVAGMVTLKVFDVVGREMETLVNEQLNAGTYEIDFDGSKLASGVYYYKLVTDGFAETKKMILVK